MHKQKTIKHSTTASGIGVHSGIKVTLSLHPAPPDHGVCFRRIDLNPAPEIPAHALNVSDTRLASTLQRDGAKVSTVEHLLSACAGLGIDNLIIDVNAEEIPIMDGSASTFVYLLLQAGIIEQEAEKRFMRIKQTIEVSEGEGAQKKWARLSPYEGFKLKFFIEFNHPAIDGANQTVCIDLTQHSYIQEVARARTFGFMHEVEYLRNNGLARGGSLDNAIVMDEYKILNPGGLRFEDEFVRHKILDAIGDLYLAGHPLLASFDAYKSGHSLNNQLLRALLAQPETYEIVTLPR